MTGQIQYFSVLLFLAAVFAENVDLEPGITLPIESPSYPDPAPANLQLSWHVTSPSGTRIKFSCYDIRLYQNNPPDCDVDAVVIKDGSDTKEICGAVYDFEMVSSSNLLDIQIRTGKYTSGGVKCTAEINEDKTSENGNSIVVSNSVVEESLELQPGAGALTINSLNYPGSPPASTKQSWLIKTSPGSTIRITCPDIRLIDTPDCASYLEVINGAEVKRICKGTDGFTLLSSGPSLRVNFGLDSPYANGLFQCNVQGRIMDWYGEATPPPPPTVPPYLGVESEEVDSSEHGGPRGTKGTTCNCGWANKQTKRIVGGRETAINEYPFMAALVVRGERRSFCGASLITHRHSLTAAHCTSTPLKYNWKLSIILGEHDQTQDSETENTQIVDVEQIIQHENYNAAIFKHDITLLVLANYVEFNQFIGPVCLSRAQMNLTRQYVRQIGWGRVAHSGYASPVLKKVDTRVIHMESCNERYGIVSVDEPTQICVYASEKGGCMGDSGGPVVWLDPETNRYTEVGLVSFGRICAGTDPSVKTDVSYYMKWIQAKIAATYPSENTCFRQD